MNTTYSYGSTQGTLTFKPAPSGKDVGSFVVWLTAFAFILAGAITLTCRNPADGDTTSDNTFFAVGWSCFAVGFIIYFVKVYLTFRGKLW